MTGLMLLIAFGMVLPCLLLLPWWAIGAFIAVGAVVVGGAALVLCGHGLDDGPSTREHY